MLSGPHFATHDLIRSILSKLSSRARKVVITDLVDSTYYAEHIQLINQLQIVDSDPVTRWPSPSGSARRANPWPRKSSASPELFHRRRQRGRRTT